MIASALRAVARAVRAPSAGRDRGAAALPIRTTIPVFHPPGAVRLVTPAEEAFQNPTVPARLAAAGPRR